MTNDKSPSSAQWAGDLSLVIYHLSFSLTEIHIIGQPVHIAGRVVWKVPLELFSDDIDGADKSSGKIAFAKVTGELSGNSLPEFLPDFRMDPAVTDHHEFLSAWHDKNQDAIVLFRVRNAEPNECFLRRLLDAAPEYWRNGDHDFSRGPALGPGDSFLHASRVDVAE
jgi:hypothetical protein